MKKLDLGQTISIVANIGVIASIIFLGIELRESNTQARISTTQESVAQGSAWREMIASDDVLLDLYVRGLKDYEHLSEIEQQQFDLLMQSFMTKTSVSLSARSVGLIGLNPDFEERAIEGALLRMLDQPGFRQWWTTADLRGIPRRIVEMTEDVRDRVTARWGEYFPEP